MMLVQLQDKIIFVAANRKILLRYMRIMQQKVPKRIVVYAKDVMNMTGRKERAAQLLLQKIREKFNKSRNGMVSVWEFCSYTGFDEDLVRDYLLD